MDCLLWAELWLTGDSKLLDPMKRLMCAKVVEYFVLSYFFLKDTKSSGACPAEFISIIIINFIIQCIEQNKRQIHNYEEFLRFKKGKGLRKGRTREGARTSPYSGQFQSSRGVLENVYPISLPSKRHTDGLPRRFPMQALIRPKLA